MRQHIFNIAITSTGRILLARDRLLGRIGRDWSSDAPPDGVSRHAIPSGANVLDAVLVQPDSKPAQASVLICHGIGETVRRWLVVQQLLAANGVASLVFDYSGYGRSTGSFNASQSERDAVAAFRCLERLTAPLPVSVLGFSLGSGIASAIVSEAPVHRLVLCAAFTSLRKAAVSIGIPRTLALLVPPIWNAQEVLRNCRVPVLVVHGEKDRLFPVRVAEELIACCGPQAELVVVPKLAHNEPFNRPRLSYWGPIVARLLQH
jgi:hypothetical protein